MKKWIKRIVLIVIAIAVINAVFSNNKPTRTNVNPSVTHTATAKPLPTKSPEQTPAENALSTPQPAGSTAPASGIRPEFKAAMDSYESFFNRCADIMMAYANNPSDMGLMMQYLDMMSQYEDALNAIDSVNEADLTNEELAYYLQVTANIEQKMLLALG